MFFTPSRGARLPPDTLAKMHTPSGSPPTLMLVASYFLEHIMDADGCNANPLGLKPAAPSSCVAVMVMVMVMVAQAGAH